MQWLHTNAAALNVDTSRVTIFGQSAGAMSVQFHLTSPLSQPLFSRAIMESSFGAMTYKSRKQALQFGALFADEMGCGDGASEAVACMRNASSDAVKAAWVAIGGDSRKITEEVIDWQNLAVALTFTPAVLETAEWPMQPNEAAAQGRIADIPMIIGYNAAGLVLTPRVNSHNSVLLINLLQPHRRSALCCLL